MILELLNNSTEEMRTSTEHKVRELDERLREVEGKCGVLLSEYEHRVPLSSYPKIQSEMNDHKNGIDASEAAREVMREEVEVVKSGKMEKHAMCPQATDVNELMKRRVERLQEDVREEIWTFVDDVEADAMIRMETSRGAEHMVSAPSGQHKLACMHE